MDKPVIYLIRVNSLPSLQEIFITLLSKESNRSGLLCTLEKVVCKYRIACRFLIFEIFNKYSKE